MPTAWEYKLFIKPKGESAEKVLIRDYSAQEKKEHLEVKEA